MSAAIVGCGLIASRWVRHLAANPRIDVAVLVDPDAAAADALAARYCLHTSYAPTFEEVLTGRELDVAVNLTPPASHAAVSRAALDAGLDVLSEKPLTLRLADAVDLVDLARERHRVLAVMQNRGHDPRFAAFGSLLRASAPGPYAIAAETFVALPRPGFRTGIALPATADLAVHAFDQIRRLVTAQPIDVHCVETPVPFLGQHCAMTQITARFTDGSIFTYRGGFTTGEALKTPATGHWNAEAANGAASWDGEATVTSTARGTTLLPASAPGYQRCLNEMVQALHGASRPGCLASDNLGSIALLDAAQTSARTGRAVPVPPIQDGARAHR